MWALIWDKTEDFVLQGKGQRAGWELSSHWKSTGVETQCKFEPFEFGITSSIQNPKTLNKSQDQWGKGKKGKTYPILTVNSTNFVKENLLVLICPIRNKMCFKIKKNHMFLVLLSQKIDTSVLSLWLQTAYLLLETKQGIKFSPNTLGFKNIHSRTKATRDRTSNSSDHYT